MPSIGHEHPVVGSASSQSGTLSSACPVVVGPARTGDLDAATDAPPVCSIWGLPFSRVTTDQTVDWIERRIERGEPGYLITANLNYVMLADRLPELESVTREAAGVLADGMPIVWRSKLARNADGPLPERVAGSELIYRMAERGGKRRWRFFFLGAAPGVAQGAADRLAAANPGLEIAGVEVPPFRRLSDEEEEALVERIAASRADCLLVAFGQPKGELWIHKHYRRLRVPVCIQLGATFDFVAGTARRAPRLFQRTGTEWLYRMLHDPRRLVPRYGDNAVWLLKRLMRGRSAW